MASVYSSPGWLGYWINPTGKAFRVETSHMNDVLGQCEKFGLTRNALEQLRAPAQYEGVLASGEEKAILDSLYNKGWIALHHYPGQGWAAELHELTDEARQRLAAFFSAIGCTPEDREPVRIQTRRGPMVVRMAQIVHIFGESGQSGRRPEFTPLMFVDGAQAIPDEEVVAIAL